ncbi:unnamed protein product [Gadus morhua 'NCC']
MKSGVNGITAAPACTLRSASAPLLMFTFSLQQSSADLNLHLIPITVRRTVEPSGLKGSSKDGWKEDRRSPESQPQRDLKLWDWSATHNVRRLKRD